jgi:hypothetical protein
MDIQSLIQMLTQGGMPQRPQGTGMSMPPQGGMDPSMSGGGAFTPPPMSESPITSALARPVGPDIMSLIRMLTQGGAGGGVPLPPLDQGAMIAGLGGAGAPPIANALTEAPTPARPAPPKPQPRTRPKKVRSEREDESRAGKMGIKTQRGNSKNKPPKGRSSYEERFASSMKD